ncbi:MAG: hypothetical protein IJU20_07290 [Clostridia bacterium]|nr:hypothetical protein [Clostridia bacterium]
MLSSPSFSFRSIHAQSGIAFSDSSAFLFHRFSNRPKRALKSFGMAGSDIMMPQKAKSVYGLSPFLVFSYHSVHRGACGQSIRASSKKGRAIGSMQLARFFRI